MKSKKKIEFDDLIGGKGPKELTKKEHDAIRA